MISREGSAIRVERAEVRMWKEVIAGSLACFGFTIAFLFGGRDPPYLQFAIPMAVLGAALAVARFRSKDVLVIEPDRIGIGDVGKEWMAWIERDRIGSASVRGLPVAAVWFYDPEGKLFHTHPFSHFEPKELRQALSEAGIPER